MTGPSGQSDLFADHEAATDGVTVIVNERCLVRNRDGHRVVVVSGVVLAQYAVGDHMAEAHAMVSLVEQGWADQNDVARAFGFTSRTVRRQQERFAENGLAALGHGAGYPRGRSRLRPSRARLVGRLKSEGLSNRAIAAQIGVTEKAVRKLVRRMGWRERSPEQESLALGRSGPADPNLSALPAAPPAAEAARPHPKDSAAAAGTSEGADPNLSAFAPTAAGGAAQSVSVDTDPADRGGDRLLAYLGLLDDAAPLFRAGTRVPRAGVLLALPALAESGVFDIAREVYGSIGPAFYGPPSSPCCSWRSCASSGPRRSRSTRPATSAASSVSTAHPR